MNKRLVQEWRTLMTTQRELVGEYLQAVGNDVAPSALREIRDLLGQVASEVEAARRFIPDMPAEPY